MSGVYLSEVVVGIMLIVIAAGVAFGFYVSGQRGAVVTSAAESIAEVKLAIEQAKQGGVPLTCSDALVSAELLQNEFITLSVKPMAITAGDASAGYGAGVFVSSSREEDGNNRFLAAEQLEQSLTEVESYTVRLSKQDEDNIAYGVLLIDEPVCATI